MDDKFSGGVNIAIKVPKSKYEQTVDFYKNILKLQVQEKDIKHPTISRTHESNSALTSFGWIALTIMRTEKCGSSLKHPTWKAQPIT